MHQTSGLTRRELLRGAAAAGVLATGGALLPRPARGDALGTRDATALAELVRRKEVTPRELATAAIERIEHVDPGLNAVVTRLFDRALERVEAGLPEGPFRGVPFLLKDLMPYADTPLQLGSVFFEDHVARETDEVARRMEQSGLVILGRTNTCELGLLPTTEPVLHGPTHNPWSLAHSPGGSSGGAAAAVAAGLVPMAQASDGGGSIRIPASCCGVFGLKPGRGRIPGSTAFGLAVEHCVSRSVRDSAGLLDATQGALPGDRWSAPPPERPYREEVGRAPGALRIAFATSDFEGHAAHADCARAVAETAKLCASLGHRVEEASPRIDGRAFGDAFLLLWASFAGRTLAGAREKLGGEPPKAAFEPFTWKLAAHDAAHTPADVVAAQEEIDRASRQLADFFARYDVLLTPVLGQPPLPLGAIDQEQPLDALFDQLRAYVGYTPLFNATGLPAMSVPLHWSEAGLPIGSHFGARPDQEALLLRLAAQLESERPWADRWPAASAQKTGS